MILVRLTGGLGNQMFQYAFGKALALKHNVPLKLDISLLGDNLDVLNLLVRNYDLDVFKLGETFATGEEVEKFNGKSNPTILDRILFKVNTIAGRYPLIIQKDNLFDAHQIAAIAKNACIVGRWQSESFFREYSTAIRQSFSFEGFIPNEYSKNISVEMERSVSVALHVRRADYVSHPVYSKMIGSLSKQYFSDAIDLLRKKFPDTKLRFFFFSDEIEWFRRQFSHLEDAVFVQQGEGKLGYQSYMWLLTKSNHSVISNSTFSWWGAWLGEKKDSIIIAPETWAKVPAYNPQNIIPDRWVKLKNTFES